MYDLPMYIDRICLFGSGANECLNGCHNCNLLIACCVNILNLLHICTTKYNYLQSNAMFFMQ